MAVPTSLFSTAAQNADPCHHRYLDRCTYSTSFVPCRIEDLRDGLSVFEREGNTLPFEDVQDRVPQGEQQARPDQLVRRDIPDQGSHDFD